MNPREDPHRNMPRIIADEHLVDLEYRTELTRKRVRGNMCEIEIDLILTADAVAVDANLEDLTRGDVARDQVAVCRIFLLEEIPTLRFRYILRIAAVTVIFRDPNTPPFAAGRFAHQPQFVFAGDRCRVHLDEFAIRIAGPLLITGRHRAAGTGH